MQEWSPSETPTRLRRKRRRTLAAALSLLAVLALAAGFPQSKAGAAGPTGLLDSSDWKIVTTLDDGTADLDAIRTAVFDDDPGTSWTSRKTQSPWGLVLQIDMQAATEFDTIVIDSGDSPNYGREYTIQSDANWEAVLAQVPGQLGVTEITVPRTTAKVVNIFETGTAATPWTVSDIKLYNGINPYPGDSGPTVQCDADSCSLNWQAVPDASGYNVYRSSSLDGEYGKIGTAIEERFSDEPLDAERSYFYRISALLPAGESGMSDAVSGITADNPFGPNVRIVDPSMSAQDIQGVADSIYARQEKNEFGSERYALLFKPGTYRDVNVNVGFYTQVAGLGRNPDDVGIVDGSVNANADWNNGNALVNFWRSSENLSVAPKAGTSAQWAVAQAAPMRRVHIKGQLELFDFDPNWNAGLASGGYLADSVVDGTIVPASQQQWFSRNDQYGGWSNGVWNMVFVGDSTPPAGTFPTDPYTVVERTPVIREKPYLYLDDSGQYAVFVPALRKDAQGVSWLSGPTPGRSIALDRFYIASPDASTSATINAALSQGMNVLFTPGIYHLSDAIRVTNPDTVVMGLGYATLIPDNGQAAMTVADADGVIVAGLLFDAGPSGSPALLEVGDKGSAADHSADPISLHDLFFRVGGAHAGKTDADLVINSNDVIGDHFWIWRADHGTSAGGWDTNDSKNGLIVNGENATIYGLFNEHHNEYQTLWNGDGGRLYFYQSEIPYEVPDQASWMSHDGTVNGYASYKVADSVTTHEAWGLGVYSYFRDADVKLNSAIEVPDTPGVKIHHATAVFLAGNGEITHVVNQAGEAANQAGVKQTIAEYAGEASEGVETALDRTAWTASAYKTGSADAAPALAIDGNAGTRWANQEAQLPGGSQWFQVDLGSAQTVDEVKLESGGDYPRGYLIQVSNDGENWTDVASGAGSETIDATFGKRTTRYIRIVQTGTAASNWWSLYEFNAFAKQAAVPATGVTLSAASLNLKERESAVLTATVSPDDATDKSVSWSSSDPTVAAVDDSGRITALQTGDAVVTATTADGAKTAQAAVHVAVGDPLPAPPTDKKGIASIQYLSGDPARLSDLGASWAYNWSVDYAGDAAGLDYVPMVWGPGAVTDDTIAKLKQGKSSGRFDSLLGYNEPELAEQSNTSVADAVKLWPRLMETGLRLGSPAVAYTYDDSYAPGKSWLDDFMTQTAQKHYPVDFIALHFYPDFTDPDAVSKLKSTLTAIHDKYGKPIWITEIGAIPFGTTRQAPTEALAETYLKQLLPMLEGLPFVERYAWFGDNCAHDQGCAYTSLYDLSDQLTPMGRIFQNPSDSSNPGSGDSEPASTLSGPDYVSPGQTFETSIGVQGLPTRFTTMQAVVHYDPAVLQVDTSVNENDGTVSLAEDAVRSLADHFVVLGTAVKADAGQILVIMASDSPDRAIESSGPLLAVRFHAAAGAAAGSAALSLSDVAVSYEGQSTAVPGTTLALPIATVDKSALDGAIADAQSKHDSAVEGPLAGQYPSGSKAELQAAIDAAAAVRDNPAATEQEVADALGELNAAVTGFSNSANPSDPIVTDKTALEDAIRMAQGKLSAAREGTKLGQYPAAAMDALRQAVQAAEQVRSNVYASQNQVDQASAELSAAVETFAKQLIALMPGETQITLNDLSIIAKYYGTLSSDPEWSRVQAADLFGSGEIDIRVLAAAAKMILAQWLSS